MYHIVKSVITAGNYKLAEIQHKIKKLYVTGDLTAGQTALLMELASEGVSLEAERPEIMETIQILANKISDLACRVKVLEGTTNDIVQYPEWKP